MLENIYNIFLVLVGFTMVIVVHELGHFWVARRVGVRVLAFAVGFGPALLSFRPGMGWRRGSSEAEYLQRGGGPHSPPAPGLSPTEYRLNVIPFGGYVKMLGQDDADPSAVSNAPDSYNVQPIWKRMAIISAGVVMNILLAAVVFNIVFLIGMKDGAPLIGSVEPGSPADVAGLRAGDRVISIDSTPIETFTDLHTRIAMARAGAPLHFAIERPMDTGMPPGVPAASDAKRPPIHNAIELDITPVINPETHLLYVGAAPARSGTLFTADEPNEQEFLRRVLDCAGLTGVQPGWSLVNIDGRPLQQAGDAVRTRSDELASVFAASDGKPVPLGFAAPTGGSVAEAKIAPAPQLLVGYIQASPDAARVEAEHLLHLAPVVRVGVVTKKGEKSGLQSGDVIAGIAGHPWPALPALYATLKENAGKTVQTNILRAGAPVGMSVEIGRDGLEGVGFENNLSIAAVSPVGELFTSRTGKETEAAPAFAADVAPGSIVTSVNGVQVSDFASFWSAIKTAAKAGSPPAPIKVALAPPPEGSGQTVASSTPREVTWTLDTAQCRAIDALSWKPPAALLNLFQEAQVEVKASGPTDALVRGVKRTRDALVQTYVTFARLFQGSVKVEHLSGPVGIADAGRRLAAQGMIYLLLFIALISANLAVVNFLPIPITDGGQMVLLCVEACTRRPVPIMVQNVVALVGLALIGTLFLVVTSYDVLRLVR